MLPLPHSRRPRRFLFATAIVVMAAAATAPGCTEYPTGNSSPVCREGSDSVIVFQGPSGRCIPGSRIVAYRCDGAAPQIVIDGGSARERRYLGGAFATRAAQLPEDAQLLGVGAGAQAVTIPDQNVLYTVRGTENQKWLSIPDAGMVRPDGPQAFMIGDSILYGGQYAITAALPEWTLAYDAVNGRSSVSGVAIAEAQAAAGYDVVVVELGTNDQSETAFRDHARQILTSLKDLPLVLWQTVKGPVEVTAADEINAAIRELATSRGNTAVADWAGSIKDEELSYDGVHPSLGNEDAMARIVAPMLRQWWSAVTAEEAGCSG
jgi:lysophospholipase L1-like esterase